jgi:TolB-like protein/Tfp pilus assembly protein PilF/predicted Ser/Thr protein kinase
MNESQSVESKAAQLVCAQCGSRLSATDAAHEICINCLLRSAIAEDDVNPGKTPRRSDQLTPGDKRAPVEFGDYELLEELGRGSQGVIYRAWQKSLNRIVALKVIALGHWATEPHVKRFRREAEAAARLNHPCIVPIYEVGERDGACYFSMGLVEGGQLDAILEREPMSIRSAVELIVKLARTVQYAHEHNILHRDIKPGNILLDPKGEPHLTDFGLARLVETESTVTRTREVLGTPSYMAPEQAAGETTKLGKATDVYGLGAVLYQLLTGYPPFAGGTTYETIKLLLDTEPRQPRFLNPKIDRDLSTICLKCLEKDPKRRYSSALALAEDLEHWLRHEPIQAHRTGIFGRGKKWVRRKPTGALLAACLVALAAAIGWNVWQGALISHPSALATNGIAVLPFENLSGNPDNAYFADGIQEEILTRLGSIADLKVISRTSTQRYQSKPRNLREIAKQLGVAHILEGSVQKAADQVRVNVQLINAQTDSHLWADTYDRKLTDLFAVETEIATKIADTLQAKLTGSEKQAIAARPTESSEAHELYLRGRFYWNKGLGPEFDKSRQYYQQAVELDPNYALAYVGLADFYGFAFAVGLLPPEEKWAKMEEYMAKKALELDPTLGEAYNPLAAAKLYYHRDWPAAEGDFRRGLELSPNSAEMHAHYAVCLLLFSRNQEAFAEMQRALNPDPLSPRFGFWLGWLHFFTRQYDAAIKQFRKTLELDSNLPILHEYLGYTYEKKQMHKEAIAEWSKGLRLIGADEDASLLERTYTESGFDAALRALAQKRLETFKEKTGRGEYVPAHEYVVAYMRLDDKEQAFAWLAKVFAERNRFAFEITVNPIFDSLRSDPRFKNIVASFAPKGN